MLDAITSSSRLDAQATMPMAELSACCGLSPAELNELIEYAALPSLNATGAAQVFSAQWVVPLRTLAKLRVEYDLEIFSLAIVLGHLDRIAQLELQVRSLQAQLPRRQLATLVSDSPAVAIDPHPSR